MDWDSLGFGLIPTDYMYMMKCSQDGRFSEGEVKRFGNIELNPSAGVLNYGQVGFSNTSSLSFITYFIRESFAMRNTCNL